MKLQHLSVIFIIIMLPIILVLSTYIGIQMDTLQLQSAYNTKLNDATHDAMQAFQLNTQNNDYSTVADSLKRDVAASINTFYTSMAANMGVSGYSKEELHPYIPAVLYTMYDGYYIYSPTKTEVDKESENLLKQYIYYSARYVNDSNNTDVVINYSLDSYISVYGIVKGKYVARSGYLIQYGTEGLKEINGKSVDQYYVEVDGEEYPPLNSGKTKIKDGAIWDSTNAQTPITSILYNGKTISPEDGVVVRGDNNNFIKVDSNSKEALYYYLEAYEFSKYISEIGLNNAIKDATVYINDKQADVSTADLFMLTNTDPENLQSDFVNHKREIIRLNIEDNLQNAFNNYKGSVGNSYDYQLPKFKEEEWEKIYKNISVVTFMQGIQVGSKMYNNYSIVTSTGNEEYVDPEELYFIDGEVYYRITDAPNTAKIGYRSSMFEPRNTINGEKQIVDSNEVKVDIVSKIHNNGIPITADYNSIVNSKSISVYSGTGELAGNIGDNKKEVYYTSLARERYEVLKLRATSILNTSQTIKTKILASAQSAGITEGEISATIKPANMFSANNRCTYQIEGTTISGESDEFINGNVIIPATGLNPNTTYTVKVTAVDNYGITRTDVATFTTGTINTANVISEEWDKGTITATVRAQNLNDDQQIYVKKNDEENNTIGEVGHNDVKISGLQDKDRTQTSEDYLTMWVQGEEKKGAENTYYIKANDTIAPSIEASNIVLTDSSITFNLTAIDNESGFAEGTKFDVRVYKKDSNENPKVYVYDKNTSDGINEITKNDITIGELNKYQSYYIYVVVYDRYGNTGVLDTSSNGQYFVIKPENNEEEVPDAIVELVDPNNKPQEDPNKLQANIIAYCSPISYVDGEGEKYKKQDYKGSGTKVKLWFENKLTDNKYRIQYKKFGDNTWNHYPINENNTGEIFEISENAAYYVRFIYTDEEGNTTAGKETLFNIGNIDKTAPEIKTEEIKEEDGTFSLKVTAKDTGKGNSGLKEYEIQLIDFNGNKTTITKEEIGLAEYDDKTNTGDNTGEGVSHTISNIGYVDGNKILYKQIIITATDCVGRTNTKTIDAFNEGTKPTIELLSVTNTNDIDKNYASSAHNIEIQFRIYDSKGNMDLDLANFNIESFRITVAGDIANITDKTLSRSGDTYTLTLKGIFGNGILNVEVKKDAIKDYVENGNIRTSLLPNNKADTINNITIDNTAPVVTTIANPEDVSPYAILANENNEDGKKTEISLDVDDISGIYTCTFEIQDKFNLKEKIIKTETLTGPDYKYYQQVPTYTLQTTFGIYNVRVYNIQDRAGNKTATTEPIQVLDYTIKTKEEMKIFQQYVAKGETFEGKTVTLLNDIDLQGSESNQWTPISTSSKPFNGIFDGRKHCVSGIYINNTSLSSVGFFGYISNSATIQNLTVAGSIRGKGENVGGIVGYNKGTIINCNNKVSVTGTNANAADVGGIAGYNAGTIQNSLNQASVLTNPMKYAFAGGIAGSNAGTIQNCYNTASISGKGLSGTLRRRIFCMVGLCRRNCRRYFRTNTKLL